MLKTKELQIKNVLLLTMIGLQLAGCASSKPVLYPNAYLIRVGQEQANRDIAECQALAKDYASPSNTGKSTAKSTAVGAGVGAASGAVAGAISGSAARGSAAGAAAGATAGLIHSLFRGSVPNQAYRNLVERCLRERGYESIGWD